MRPGVSLRVAVLAAILTVLGIVMAVLPLLYQLNTQLEVDARRSVQAMVTLALQQPTDLPQGSLQGWVGITAAGAPTDQAQVPVALAAICPVPLSQGEVFPIGPVEVQGADYVGACGMTKLGTTMLGWQDAPASGRWTLHIFKLALLAACISGAVVFLGVSRLLSPLKQIAEFAASLKPGHRPQALPDFEAADLSHLSGALNQLASTLAARELEVASRQELTRELGSVVAHEVRNPLQSVVMLSDLLAHEPDRAERLHTLAEIQAEILLIEQVVQRLLSSDGHLRLVHKPMDLRVLLSRAVSLHIPRAKQVGLTLTASLPEGELMVNGDAPLLRRAVENLLQNAVAVLSVQGGSTVHLALVVEAEQVLIAVEDDGPGVPLALREQIFESGVSLRAGGSGLGLSLARRVVQAHGGALEVDSSPLGGARFLITLPGATV